MALTDFSESSGERNIERDGQLLLTDFSSDQWSRISEFYYQEADRREKKIKEEKKDIFREDKSSDETSILHSDGVYSMKNKINSSLTDLSSFPWQDISEDMKILEKETFNFRFMRIDITFFCPTFIGKAVSLRVVGRSVLRRYSRTYCCVGTSIKILRGLDSSPRGQSPLD